MTKQYISQTEKINLFKKVLKEDIIGKKDVISNDELREIVQEKFGVRIYESEIVKLGFRDLLRENGIMTKLEQKNNKMDILNKAINLIKEKNIEIKTIADMHRIASTFGSISRSTLDNHLSYITKHIDIKNLKYRKRAKYLELSDKEIITEVAKKIIKKNVYVITASEFRKYTNSSYRTVDIEIIRKHKDYLFNTYEINLTNSQDSKQEDFSHYLENALNILKISNRYPLVVSRVDDLNSIKSYNLDSFTVASTLDLQKNWYDYIDIYLNWLKDKRINVKNGFFDSKNRLSIDTEKKKIVLLQHHKLDIATMRFEDFLKLTMMITKASHKTYGIHLQNMYIGFLFFLQKKNKLIIPFSYLYDVCFSNRKVQEELKYFLAEHTINKKLLKYIDEKRLNVKDDKYKRICQFLLLSFPREYSILSITYTQLTPLLHRSKSDHKRVVKIFNILGANIKNDKPKQKYVDNYNKYIHQKKYNKLINTFNKAMDRAYKLGDYSKEKSVYKDWSSQYALFMDFIETNYGNEVITENFLYTILDYPDEDKILTYQEFIIEQNLSANTKSRRFTPLIVAFSDNNIYLSLKALKDKVPVFKDTNAGSSKNTHRRAITNPIVLTKLEDILKNRPPASKYHKQIKVTEEYKKWWKHFDKVYPFEPLILLAHLYIPARGINFRLADHRTFLVKNENNKTTGYHFTHDKNKKRKTPYIAPNIWGDKLEIIEMLTKYVKFQFPTMLPITYDSQNPHGILPLFPNKEGTGFYSEDTHMKYWKRVLLKAQIEFNSEENEENISLIFPISDLPIPQNPDDVDTLSQGNLEKFQVRYDLHSLRHTGATTYANAGMPLGLLALLTGHIDMNVLQSVYIELNAQKMIEMWKNVQNIDIGNNTSLAEAGKTLIYHSEAIAKEVLGENSPEKLLQFLEEGNFISIGSYLNKDELTLYELGDFAKIDPVFWSFKRYGICTSSQCPQGLENRCSLCPHFITSPAYIQEVAAHINLQNFRLAKYGNMIIENRKKGNPKDNENIRKSAQIEMEEMLGWIKILQALDEVRLMVDKNVAISNTCNKDLTVQDMKEISIFSLAPIANSDHSLLKLVYDSIEFKEFEHESFQDASEKLVSKIIRYAARNNSFDEVDGKDKYQIIEWFRPIYRDVLALERDESQKDKLENILNFLSDKPSGNMISQNKMLFLDSKESE